MDVLIGNVEVVVTEAKEPVTTEDTNEQNEVVEDTAEES